MTYAIGRGLEVDDMPMLRALTREAAKDNYKFSTIVMTVVTSPAFTMNQKSTAVVAMNQE